MDNGGTPTATRLCLEQGVGVGCTKVLMGRYCGALVGLTWQWWSLLTVTRASGILTWPGLVGMSYAPMMQLVGTTWFMENGTKNTFLRLQSPFREPLLPSASWFPAWPSHLALGSMSWSISVSDGIHSLRHSKAWRMAGTRRKVKLHKRDCWAC